VKVDPPASSLPRRNEPDVPAKPQPSDDPVERKRALVLAHEAYNAALDQNALDGHAGRVPKFGAGALDVLAKRLAAARTAVDEIREPEPA